jgi:hypothetical protein
MTEPEREEGRLPPFGEALRMIQDIGAQLAGAAQAMADDFARSPGERFAAPIARLGAQITELSTLWVAPVRSMLQEQQDLIDALAAWSAQQRELADRFATLAERHRALNAQVMALLEPMFDQAERLRSAATEVRSRSDESS